MKVIHLNHSDITGGAARAAYRIHNCLLQSSVTSRMWVNVASAGDYTVHSTATRAARMMMVLRSQMVSPIINLHKTQNTALRSPALLCSNWVRRINDSDADIANLHWVQAEMLSIADIGRIQKPIVWTLHDMWAFCGAEHYCHDNRWQEGYHRTNRPEHEFGFDLNRWTWLRKRKHWQRTMNIVTPSNWLANCVRASALMRDWSVSVIPYPIDTERWKPLEKSTARELLGLPKDKPLLLFGAMGGSSDPRKGFDLLKDALKKLRYESKISGTELVVFGERKPEIEPNFGFPAHFTGHLHDDFSLIALYSAADAMVIPSRQDNLPNTGIEAQACGTPVIAFNTGGLPELVEHKNTGYIAEQFDTEDLSNGIAWVLQNNNDNILGRQARMRTTTLYSETTIAQQYERLYKEILKS